MLPVEIPAVGALLRPWRIDDAEDIAAACNDPLTQRFLPLLPRPYTRDDALWWISHGAPAAFAAGGAAYAVTDGDRLVGGIGVSDVGQNGTSAQVGYWTAPWGRRRGLASAATRALTGYAFANGVERMELRTVWENGPSQRVAIAAGFSREGVRRGAGRGPAGDRTDRIIWARLAGDPEGPTTRLLPDLPGGTLTDGVITLRRLGPGDAADTYALRSQPDVYARSVPPMAPDRAAIDRACARAEAYWLAGERADLAILDATGGYTGEISLYYQEPPTGQAMIGYSLSPHGRGQGYATRAVRLLATWAFAQAGVERLIAGTAPDNQPSQRVLRRAGFHREGYQRSRLPGPDGTRVDDLLWALLPEAGKADQQES